MDLLYGLIVFGLAFAAFACVVVLHSMGRRWLGVNDPVGDLWRRWREGCGCAVAADGRRGMCAGHFLESLDP